MRAFTNRSLFLSQFFAILLNAMPCSAQPSLNFEHFTTENGLSNNIIYSVIQDSKGYLWIGTHDGLNRYDGYSFKVFRNDPLNVRSLQGNIIHVVAEDRSGDIWIGTNAGLCRFSQADGSFTRILNTSGSDEVWQILPVSSNEIMVITGAQFDTKKFIILNIQTLSQTIIEYRSFAPAEYSVPALPVANEEGQMLTAFNNGPNIRLAKYNAKAKEFSIIRSVLIKGIKEKKGAPLRYFFIDSKKRLWVETGFGDLEGELRIIGTNEDEQELVSDQSRIGVVRKIIETANGRIWICTTKGLFQFATNNEGKADLVEVPVEGKSHEMIQLGILIDQKGILWVSGFNGLYKSSSWSSAFHSLSADNKPATLYQPSVLGIFQDRPGTLRIHYLFGSSFYSILDLANSGLRHLRRYDSGRIMQALRNPAAIHPEVYSAIKNSLKPAYSMEPGQAVVDQQQQVWGIMGSDFMHFNTWKSFYPGVYVNDILLDGDWIWLATNSGLMVFDRVKKTHIKSYLNEVNNEQSLSSNFLNCLLRGNGDTLWIGTKNAGFNCFNISKEQFTRFTVKDGLCFNSIYSMVADSEGSLWLGTGNGLSCFNPFTKKFRNFSRADGLLNTEYNRHSAIKADNGMIYMGGMNGIDYFDPHALNFSVTNPVTRITEIRLFNKPLSVSQKYSFGYEQNYLTVFFAVMDFTKPSGNNFLYKLEGVDGSWINSESRNYATYAHLTPGKYRFLVKGSDSNGNWSDEAAAFEFVVKGPWWRSAWFLSLCVLLVMAGFIIFYKYRIRQLKKIHLLRSKISRDLHDEVGATLTSISFLSEVVKKQNSEGGRMAPEILEKIGSFSRDMIGEMNDIVWAINPANDKLEKLEERMYNFASTHLSAKNIGLNFQADEQIRQLSLGMQQRKNLFLIFKEAVNNAAKYSDCNRLSVVINKVDHSICMEISDNGRGFAEGTKVNGNGGNGLQNMQARAEEINSKFSVESIPGKGTTIRFVMPITQNAY